MRVTIAMLCLLAVPAEACPIYDYTQVWATGQRNQHWSLPEIGVVSPHPRMFVDVGRDSDPGFPRFTTGDGTPVPYVTERLEEGRDLFQVDLDIDDGVILVLEPGSKHPAAFYFVAPQLTRSTCVTAILNPCGDEDLLIQSTAVMFRIELDGEAPIYTHWPAFDHIGEPRRVTALYGDRTEEVLYVRPPKRRSLTWIPLALFALSLALGHGALQRETTT